MVVKIDALPDRILAHVLGFCPAPERDKLKCVCTRWGKVISKYHGAYIIAGGMSGGKLTKLMVSSGRKVTGSAYIDAIESFRSIDWASAKKAEDAGDADAINNNTVPNVNEQNVQDFKIDNSEFIQKLSFVAQIPIQVSANVLGSCKNLNAVDFHVSFLSGVPSNIPLTLDIPTLQTFAINSSGIREHWEHFGEQEIQEPVPFLNWPNIYQVIGGLLNQNTFYHLKNLVVDVPFCAKTEKSMYTDLSKFLAKHAKTIESFCYHQGFQLNLPSAFEDENNNIDDNEGEDMETEDPEDISLKSLSLSATEIKNVQLRDIHFALCCDQESDALWKNFIIQQNQIRRLIFTGIGSRINFPTKTIEESAKSLVTLILEVRDNVNLLPLAGCSLLRKFILIGSPDPYDDPKKANVKHITCLPISLEFIGIQCLKIHRGDTHELLCNPKWKALKEIEFSKCGIEGDMGVRIQTISHVWAQKRLSHFLIDQSLNRKSLREEPMPENCILLAHNILGSSVSGFQFEGFLLNGKYGNDPNPNMIEEESLFETENDLFAFPEQITPVGTRSSLTKIGEEDSDEETTTETESEYTTESESEDEGGDA